MKKTENDFKSVERYNESELMARLKFIVGICLAITLMGIVFVVLYSIIFVTQPLGAISPVDSKFFELIIPIATFLTGTLSGIMLAGNNKEAQMKALEAATARPTATPLSTTGSLNMQPMSTTMESTQFGTGSSKSLGGFRSSSDIDSGNHVGLTNHGGKLGPAQPFHPEI
jgi:hypothetical protein